MTKIHFGNTNGEHFHVPGDITGNSFTFGDGAADFVQSDAGDISDNTIQFGSGAGDYVQAYNGSSTGGNISNNTIQFGSGFR